MKSSKRLRTFAPINRHIRRMEIVYYIFYAVLILGPLLIAGVALVLMPVWYVFKAYALIQRYGVFGLKAVGWSLAALIVGAALKPPAIYNKRAVDLDNLIARIDAMKIGAHPPPAPPEKLDMFQTIFALIAQPPVFLYIAVIGSFFAFRWLLRWQPTEPSA